MPVGGIFRYENTIRQSGGLMKRSWMGVIMAGAILSSGCATIAGGAVDLSGGRSGPAMRPGGAGPGAPLKLGGARPGTGDAMAFRRGPVHAIDGEDYHSLADPETWTPSPVSLAWSARQPPWLGPDESPLIENGIFAWGVKGLPGADIRRLGLGGYAKSCPLVFWPPRCRFRNAGRSAPIPSTRSPS